MRNLVVFIGLVFLCGCAHKEPSIAYHEVAIPVRCGAQMPIKPKFDETFESAKRLGVYFLQCERLLKICIGLKDENG